MVNRNFDNVQNRVRSFVSVSGSNDISYKEMWVIP